MIGQSKLLNTLEELIANHTLPHFVILVGSKGSGKKLLANNVAKQLADNVVQLEGIGIEHIRGMITEAYRTHNTCYIIPDADGMSVGAKNALLKVTEEPPNDVYFIMTLEDTNNTLSTITSRGTAYHLEPYSKDDIKTYIQQTYKVKPETKSIIASVCDTPGEVNEMMSTDPDKFYEYVELVVDNITEVSGANAFKIPSKVAIKDTDEGYDLKLFWKLYVKKCFDLALSQDTGIDKVIHLHQVGVTSRYLQDLRTKGINKQMLMDNWILDIRRESIDGNKQSA